jgi:hypothetical protein
MAAVNYIHSLKQEQQLFIYNKKMSTKSTVPSYFDISDTQHNLMQLDDGIPDEDTENDTIVYQKPLPRVPNLSS